MVHVSNAYLSTLLASSTEDLIHTLDLARPTRYQPSCRGQFYKGDEEEEQEEMPEQKNVNTWRILHVLIYICSIGTSMGALLSYRNMNQSFQKDVDKDKCMLYTQPWVELNPKTGNCHIDLARAKWKGGSVCNYVLFAMLASFVYGIIAVWFFIMCAPSTRGMQDDSIVHVWKIVPPASVFSSLLFLLTFVMAWSVSRGLGAFFSDLDAGVHMNCSTKDGGPAAWDNDSNVAALYNERLITQIFVWLMVVSWGMATLTLACRCLTAADFSTNAEVRFLRRTLLIIGGDEYLDL